MTFEDFLKVQKKAFEDERDAILTEKNEQLEKGVEKLTNKYKISFGIIGAVMGIAVTLMTFKFVFPRTGSFMLSLFAGVGLSVVCAAGVLFIGMRIIDEKLTMQVEELLIPVEETELWYEEAEQEFEEAFYDFVSKMGYDFCSYIADSDFSRNLDRIVLTYSFSVYKDRIFSESGSFTFKTYIESDADVIGLSRAIAESIKNKIEDNMADFKGADKTLKVTDMRKTEEPQISLIYTACKESLS